MNEDDPVAIIWGLAIEAQDTGRLIDFKSPPVRGISEIGANLDRLTDEQWMELLKKAPKDILSDFAKLHLIPPEVREQHLDVLMHISGTDPGFTPGDWDVTQSFIDFLSANDETLEKIARMVAVLDILT